jgi:hypothetical protein
MDAGAFGVHQPASHAYNPFASAGTGVRQPGVAPLFPSRGAPTHGLPGGYSGFAVSPAAVPTLDQMLRGSFNLPLNSSAGSLRFTYQDFLRPGASFAGLDHPAASLMFSTSGLANGVVLSAGTTFGSHSVAGTPAATLNGTAVGPPKSSGPSLNLKLSF